MAGEQRPAASADAGAHLERLLWLRGHPAGAGCGGVRGPIRWTGRQRLVRTGSFSVSRPPLPTPCDSVSQRSKCTSEFNQVAVLKCERTRRLCNTYLRTSLRPPRCALPPQPHPSGGGCRGGGGGGDGGDGDGGSW